MKRLNRISDVLLLTALVAAWIGVVLACRQSFAAPQAKTFAGTVVKVSDADTLWVQKDRVTHKVRVTAIDAPEKDQPWGKEATKAASDLALGKEVIVTWRWKDRYGRILGSVKIGEKDYATEMVGGGHAWLYRAYSSDAALAKLQADAKEAKRGLWAGENPIPPWEWRRGER